MALAKDLLLTAEDYRLMPETGPRYQLIEGQLYVSPAPNRYHQDISRNIEFILLTFLQDHPLGKVYDAPFDVRLGEHNVFQPDIIFVANERLSILTKAGAEGAPNLVIEILSPSTAELDRIPKRKTYSAAGVQELWLVDPEKKTIEVYRLQTDSQHPAAVHQATDSFQSSCLPGLTFDGAAVFKQ
jgi:Uma2 family endonuclease